MIFNQFSFIYLFPIIFIVYYVASFYVKKLHLNNKLNNGLLVCISYLLYAQYNVACTLCLFYITLLTYVFALILDDKQQKKIQKIYIVIGSVLVLLPLALFKYYNFIAEMVNACFEKMNVATSYPGINWIVPLGISFYTFQAIGYLFDVYYHRIKAERNWLDYMLFVSFFPQIVSGPISKASDLLPQIKRERVFSRLQAEKGLMLFVYGLFLKVMLADRIGMYVDVVLGNYAYQSGTSCLFASLLYSFQIYADFAGYSFMAIGVGKMIGFDLINNFKRPYLSISVTDFWHRWHISLSTWLRDYVYIPLGGSRCSKARNYVNIALTFLVSGIWHGANWTFIFWGFLHGLLQILEKMFGIQQCKSSHVLVHCCRIVVTFLLVSFAWIFFRQPSLYDAWRVIVKICTDHGDLYRASNSDIVFSFVALVSLFVVDLMVEFKGRALKKWLSKSVTLRLSLCLLILLITLWCGVLDSSQFIYAKF